MLIHPRISNIDPSLMDKVIKQHQDDYSISMIAHTNEMKIFDVMLIIRTLDKVSEDIDEDWDFIESGK